MSLLHISHYSDGTSFCLHRRKNETATLNINNRGALSTAIVLQARGVKCSNPCTMEIIYYGSELFLSFCKDDMRSNDNNLLCGLI